MQLPGQAPQVHRRSTSTPQTLGDTRGIAFQEVSGFRSSCRLIVFSHGLTGSPISTGYVSVLVQLAAQGFMVAGVFHGDPRFSRVRIEDLERRSSTSSRNFGEVVELETDAAAFAEGDARRPVLADPGSRPASTPTRIGGFGASMGGAAMTYARRRRTPAPRLARTATTPVHDPRIRAFVGYVPWAGYSFLHGFCSNQSGAKFVNRPYLAISGTADTTAPLTQMKQALNNFTNTRYMVELQDGQHELRPRGRGRPLHVDGDLLQRLPRRVVRSRRRSAASCAWRTCRGRAASTR